MNGISNKVIIVVTNIPITNDDKKYKYLFKFNSIDDTIYNNAQIATFYTSRYGINFNISPDKISEIIESTCKTFLVSILLLYIIILYEN